MKHYLLIFLLLFTISINSQEGEKTRKANHSFSLSGGVFGQTGTRDYHGLSYSISYQAYYPNRFIFGLQFLRDEAKYKSLNPDKDPYDKRKMLGYSGGFQLGLHAIRRKRFDLSVLVVPHFNTQRYITKYYSELDNKFKTSKQEITYLFVPIIAYRVESFYKFNPSHGLGLTTDVNLEFEWNGIGDLLAVDIFVVGRLMLTYRVTILNGKTENISY
jgi:hypothetical protein